MSQSSLLLSEFHVIFPNGGVYQPLGILLQDADLISAVQVQQALTEQKTGLNVPIGEILVQKGWINPQTVSFFAEDWYTLLQQSSRQPLGYYLKAAGLLNEIQIRYLLKMQSQIDLRLGALAVGQNLLKSTTLDFFLAYLFPEHRFASQWRPETREAGEILIDSPTNACFSTDFSISF